MAPVEQQKHYVTKQITPATPLWGATSPDGLFTIHPILPIIESGGNAYLRDGDGMRVNDTLHFASTEAGPSGFGAFNNLNKIAETLNFYLITAYIEDDALHIRSPTALDYSNISQDCDFIGALGLHEFQE